jgi:hypothetical protein
MELTPEQLTEYELRATMAERERCARIAEYWLKAWGAKSPKHVSPQKWACDAVKDIIDGIRRADARDG